MMAFDDVPEDREESYPCDCGGSIKKNAAGTEWECDSCPATFEVEDE